MTVALFLVAVLGGATAAVAGFGIGSLLTPILALSVGTPLAVAAVSIPHAAATALRFWRLRTSVDRGVLLRFGLLSAAGGLLGALLYSRLANAPLTIVLGVLLVATAVAGLTRWNTRWHARGAVPGALGIASGFFGGIVGNQGGLRAAALLAFPLTPAAYVATSTATGLIVDAARMPIYLARAGGPMRAMAMPIAVMTVGTLTGTLLGERVLLGLTPERFRQLVSLLIGVLGAWFVVHTLG
jgi:uncharacterized membrane protein YfcA